MSEHEEHSLAKVIRALHAWLERQAGFGGITLSDLRAMEHRLTVLIEKQQQPSRYIRLHVAEVRFAQPERQIMADNIAIDVPAGQIARITFAPVNEKNEPAKLDGPLTVVNTPDSPTQANVAVGGPDGLMLDIQLDGTEGSIAVLEVDGDADLDPAKREVLTTLVTARQLGAVPGKAVTLGAKSENVAFLGADQFGVFPATAAARRR